MLSEPALAHLVQSPSTHPSIFPLVPCSSSAFNLEDKWFNLYCYLLSPMYALVLSSLSPSPAYDVRLEDKWHVDFFTPVSGAAVTSWEVIPAYFLLTFSLRSFADLSSQWCECYPLIDAYSHGKRLHGDSSRLDRLPCLSCTSFSSFIQPLTLPLPFISRMVRRFVQSRPLCKAFASTSPTRSTGSPMVALTLYTSPFSYVFYPFNDCFNCFAEGVVRLLGLRWPHRRCPCLLLPQRTAGQGEALQVRVMTLNSNNL